MEVKVRLWIVLLLAVVPFTTATRCQLGPPATGDGDVDNDAIVTEEDELIVWGCWGADPASDPACAASDVEGDGDVDVWDSSIVHRQLGMTVCNGSPTLCDRSFDEVAYATTHNAFATTPRGYFPADNQSLGMPAQLADGVRALMLDTYYFDEDDDGASDGVFLCHTLPFCGHPDAFSLVAGLTEIREFLDDHPGEVVTLIFESYVSAADTASVFEQVGLLDPLNPAADYLYAHPGGPWPSLRELVETGEQLVVLTDDSLSPGEGAQHPWYQYLWTDLAFETPFSLTPEEFPDPGFSCEVNRGDALNDLLILNHFLTRVVGDPSFAELVNHDPFFHDRALGCEDFHSRIPNFVTVDFYEIGDLFGVVDALNGL